MEYAEGEILVEKKTGLRRIVIFANAKVVELAPVDARYSYTATPKYIRRNFTRMVK